LALCSLSSCALQPFARVAPIAMAPMKRPAASTAGSASKKAARDPLAAKGDEIAQMMQGAEGFPDVVIQMVSKSLSNCLLVPKDERHASQEEVVGMIEQMLASVESGLKAKVEAAQAKVAGSDSEKSKREQVVEEAQTALAEKKAAADVAKAALEEAAGEEVAAKASLADAKAEQKTGDASYVAAAEKKSTLESTLTNEFETLKQGTSETVKKSSQDVVRVGKRFGFEAQLLVSAEPALSKAPADRGAFDLLVVQQLEEQLNNLISALATELCTGEASKSERASKVEAAEAQLASTGERLQARKADVAAAQEATKEADSQCKAAKAALKELGPELEQTTSELELASDEMKACEAVLASFRYLQERTTASEMVAEPEAYADEPKEEVAAEQEDKVAVAAAE